MIISWKHKGLKKFYLSGDKSGIIADHSRKLQIILQLLDAANCPEKLNFPGFGFHKLKGDLKNFYSVTVRANWRVIFQFDDQNAVLIDYIDYIDYH
jgi:proteic killer suppression protein